MEIGMYVYMYIDIYENTLVTVLDELAVHS